MNRDCMALTSSGFHQTRGLVRALCQIYQIPIIDLQKTYSHKPRSVTRVPMDTDDPPFLEKRMNDKGLRYQKTSLQSR